MPSTQNAVNNHEYRSVPITALAESATNPRKRFDAKSLEELAASFKTQGILAPLLVRELEESKYEVVAGARRLRAAKLAELEKLPVRVVKLTDAEAIEAQCVENLQREDIHPLEEALGFKSLLELGEPAYTIATIASRAGKSEAYVYGRIRLADLIPPVAEAFLKDQITIGHALLIAKLPASQQQEAFSAAFRGLWTSEGNSQVLIPVRELAAWIESNILLQLASAPFDKQDETLVPEAGSCANCPKRTGFNKLLFPDVRKDSCTSPDCFRAKIDASVKKTLETKPQLIQISAAWNSREGAPLGRNQYVELEIKKPKANGASTKLPANQKPCDKMAEAIVMDGGKRGQVVQIPPVFLTSPPLKIEGDARGWLGTAHERVPGSRHLQWLRVISNRSGNQASHAGVTDSSPARPSDRNIARFRQLKETREFRVPRRGNSTARE